MRCVEANDNSIHIGRGTDFPSKDVKYFINIISFILLNFLWCDVYNSLFQMDKQPQRNVWSPQKPMRPAHSVNGLWWMESFIHLLIHSTRRHQAAFHAVGTASRAVGAGRQEQSMLSGSGAGQQHGKLQAQEARRSWKAGAQVVMWGKPQAGPRPADIQESMFTNTHTFIFIAMKNRQHRLLSKTLTKEIPSSKHVYL